MIHHFWFSCFFQPWRGLSNSERVVPSERFHDLWDCAELIKPHKNKCTVTVHHWQDGDSERYCVTWKGFKFNVEHLRFCGNLLKYYLSSLSLLLFIIVYFTRINRFFVWSFWPGSRLISKFKDFGLEKALKLQNHTPLFVQFFAAQQDLRLKHFKLRAARHRLPILMADRHCFKSVFLGGTNNWTVYSLFSHQADLVLCQKFWCLMFCLYESAKLMQIRDLPNLRCH